MSKIFLLALFATLLVAQENPNAFSPLGDPIYDNVKNIEKLKKTRALASYAQNIDEYFLRVQKAKDLGSNIDSGNKTEKKGEYLKELRSLTKRNSHFNALAYKAYRGSMQKEENETFQTIINTGLIDTRKNKEEILAYYKKHKKEIDTTGVIAGWLNDEKLKKAKLLAEKKPKKPKTVKKSSTKKQKYATKKELQAAKIKRIRAKDKRKRDAFAKKVDDELLKTQNEIRAKQQRELGN